jgi:hypothetical protein
MISLIGSYFIWHYSKAIADLFGVASNYIWFVWHFFSISTLSKTLFSPWERMGEDHKRGEGVEGFFETFIVNTIMRLVGFVMRSCIIITGLITLVVVISISIFIFCFWIVLPFAIALLLVSGVRLLLM